MDGNLSLFDNSEGAFLGKIQEAIALLDGVSWEKRIDWLNKARSLLSMKSPMNAHPVDCVLWVPVDEVSANDYNPNNVAPPEMRLLEQSIRADGYTMPSVVTRSPAGYEVVDGWHRRRIAKEKMRDEMYGLLPVSILNRSYEDRMASTIRHNRARGVHAVTPMTDIVARLCKAGWGDQEIGKHLGMDKDEVLRLKQCSGLAEIFKDREFSMAWE